MHTDLSQRLLPTFIAWSLGTEPTNVYISYFRKKYYNGTGKMYKNNELLLLFLLLVPARTLALPRLSSRSQFSLVTAPSNRNLTWTFRSCPIQ
jgi:hypothetical protein